MFNTFLEKLSAGIGVVAEKITGIKFLMALAETMQALLSLTMIGAFGCLFAFVDIGGWQDFLSAYPNIKSFFMAMQFCTLSIISLYVLLLLPYQYAEKLGIQEKQFMIPLSVSAFLLITPVNLYSDIPATWLGSAGMFSAMLVSWIVCRVVKLFFDHNITIKMPAGVPKVVEATFKLVVPAFVLLTVFGIIGRVMLQTEYGTVHQLIYSLIQAPLQDVGLSLPVWLLAQVLSTVFMFCGIHGTTATSWLTPLKDAAAVEQMAAWAAGEPLPRIIVGAFENCCTIGGLGATLGLGIVLVIFAKSKRYKQLSRMAIVPQIFNIGEPLLFGIPIMLNPVLFIPYLGGVLVNTLITYAAVASGIVARFTGVTVAWTLPSPIKCMLGCSVPWQGLLLCLFNLAIDMLIWYPFVKIIDNQALAEEKRLEEEAKAAQIAE